MFLDTQTVDIQSRADVDVFFVKQTMDEFEELDQTIAFP